MTNWSNISTFEQVIVQANAYAPFWTVMLMMIWMVLVITFLQMGIVIALVSGCFLAGVIGIFLVLMGLVAWKWVLGLFALGIVMLIIETFFVDKN